MLDLKFIIKNPDLIKELSLKKNMNFNLELLLENLNRGDRK